MTMTHRGNLPAIGSVNGREIEGTFRDVLFSPTARYNLLSVSQIEEHGGMVEFADGKATIKSQGRVAAIGYREGGLY